MEPITTLGTAIATAFLTKVFDKANDKLSKALIDKTGQAAKIREHSPETAKALETGNEGVLSVEIKAFNM
ncbi:hypothetical protein V2H45_06460 [Tumidithrix elongata RA019]|uniref:Uncharacterized protein n=1 Tax=Tumidithrix elongata BACA0141 TaxID=2716417 RepID=A0AAW9PYQ1_9CYAN|nr:hypothetical protein [Tumidithrix elongata RA019]